MKDSDRYLPMSRMFEPVRSLFPSLCLMILIAFSSTPSVLGQSTADVCRQNASLLQQLERERDELSQKNALKEDEKDFRDNLSDLNNAITNGRLMDMNDLAFLAEKLKVELPKNLITGEPKEIGMLSIPERSALQRTIRSALQRGLEDAVNTPWDRLKDRIEKNNYFIQSRRQKMRDLNCDQDEDGEGGGNDPATNISGTWIVQQGSITGTLRLMQSGTRLSGSMDWNGHADATIESGSYTEGTMRIVLSYANGVTGTYTAQINSSGQTTRNGTARASTGATVTWSGKKL